MTSYLMTCQVVTSSLILNFLVQVNCKVVSDFHTFLGVSCFTFRSASYKEAELADHDCTARGSRRPSDESRERKRRENRRRFNARVRRVDRLAAGEFSAEDFFVRLTKVKTGSRRPEQTKLYLSLVYGLPRSLKLTLGAWSTLGPSAA